MEDSMFKTMIQAALVCLLVTGCAEQQAKQRTPVLYPNEQVTRKSAAEVDRDIQDCDFKADHYVKKPTTGEQVRDVLLGAAESAVVGTAAGALTGAITGHAGRTTGAGAAVGGLVGAYGAIKEVNKVDPKERGYIKACLEEKGYKVIGWENE